MALSLARASAGKSMLAKMAMIAMTTRSSINVKPEMGFRCVGGRVCIDSRERGWD